MVYKSLRFVRFACLLALGLLLNVLLWKPLYSEIVCGFGCSTEWLSKFGWGVAILVCILALPFALFELMGGGKADDKSYTRQNTE